MTEDRGDWIEPEESDDADVEPETDDDAGADDADLADLDPDEPEMGREG